MNIIPDFLKLFSAFKFLIFFVVCNLLFIPDFASAQKFIQDSLIVSFKEVNDNRLIHIELDSIVDKRDEHPRVVGHYEVMEYFVIPVDLNVMTDKFLTHEIIEAFHLSKDSNLMNHYYFILNEFRLILKTNSFFFPRYQLNAAIEIHQTDSMKKDIFIGELVYESAFRKPFFGDKLKKGYEGALHRWQDEFVRDFSFLVNNETGKLENFRVEKYTGNNANLISAIDFSVFQHTRITDGCLFFSHREPISRFFRSGGLNIRYRDADDFESIEFGLLTDYIFQRLNTKYLLRAKASLMIGINRWKDLNQTKHKVYDAFICDYSMNQSLLYNPLDRRSVTWGLGLQENLFYIYSKKIKLQIGILFHLGIKL